MLGPSVRLLGNRFSAKYQLVGDEEDTEQASRIKYFRESLENDVAELLNARSRSRQRVQSERQNTENDDNSIHHRSTSWK